VLLAAIVLVAAAIGGYVVSERDPGADGSASPTASPTPSPSAAALPEGWTRYEDPEGWSVGVPPEYVRTDRRGQVQLRDEQRRRTLRLDVVETTDGAAATLTGLSRAYASQLARYQELRLEPVVYRDRTAVELEFTYVDGTALHVVDRAFEDEAGERVYTAYWQTNERDFSDSLPVFEQVMDTFEPAG
jgi:hypothetical protein